MSTDTKTRRGSKCLQSMGSKNLYTWDKKRTLKKCASFGTPKGRVNRTKRDLSGGYDIDGSRLPSLCNRGSSKQDLLSRWNLQSHWDKKRTLEKCAGFGTPKGRVNRTKRDLSGGYVIDGPRLPSLCNRGSSKQGLLSRWNLQSHWDKKMHTWKVCWFWYSQGDSNPCFRRERAAS